MSEQVGVLMTGSQVGRRNEGQGRVVYLYVYMCVFQCVCFSMCVCVFQCVCMCVWFSVCVVFSVCVCVCVRIRFGMRTASPLYMENRSLHSLQLYT